MSGLKRIIFIFLLWRAFLFLPLLAGHYMIPYQADSPYTNLWKFIKPYHPVDHFLIYPWANFDGVHYLSIAGNGYKDDGRFFPLYPLLIRFLSAPLGTGEPFGGVQFFTALLISNIAFLFALITFYKLIQLDFSKIIAFSSIIFLLVFPTSFYFVSLYSESLFLLLALLSLYFARKQNWLLASIFGSLLCVTRLVGIVIFPVLIFEFLKQNRSKNIFKIIPLLIILAGLLVFSWFNLQKWNDPLYFLHAQGMLSNSRSVNTIVFFPQTIFRYSKILTSLSFSQFEWLVALLELCTFILVGIMLYLAWKKRIYISYLLFGLLCFLIPALSGTFTGLPRYSLAVFPVFIVLALVLERKTRLIYLIICLILSFILLMFFSRGYYIA